jgi:hypothetical protein
MDGMWKGYAGRKDGKIKPRRTKQLANQSHVWGGKALSRLMRIVNMKGLFRTTTKKSSILVPVQKKTKIVFG